MLTLNLLLFSYLGVSNILLSYFIENSQPKLFDYVQLLTSVTEALSMILLYPLAGWLADVYCGRYKVIRTSIMLMWIAIVATGGTMVAVHIFSQSRALHTAAYYGIFPLFLVVMYVGMAGLKPNLVVFGIDQLQESSSEEINAFIAWYGWVEVFGLGMITYFCYWNKNVAILSQALIQAGLTTVAVCLDFLCRGWLITDPETPNPLQTIARVIKYAAQNKAPRFRSAFTYCTHEVPSRVDFAKTEYGGPFSAEQVEDVKTFFRILCVLVTFFGYYIGGEDTYDISSHLRTKVYDQDLHGYCSGKLIDLSGSDLFVPAILLYVPIYELVVYPIFHRYIPGMFKWIGFGMVIMFCCVLSQLILDIVGHTSSTSVPCLFVPMENGTAVTLNLSHKWYGLPSALSGLALMVFYISSYQFVLAQTPYSMKGLMVGLFYMLRGFFSIIRIIITQSFSLSFAQHPITAPSCGFWYYLLNCLIVAAGFVVFCAVGRRYRRRERGQNVYERAYVEKYFERP